MNKLELTLLENLLDRIERDPETGKYRLAGAISDKEFGLLRKALRELGSGEVGLEMSRPENASTRLSPSDQKETGATPETIELPARLDLASLDRNKPTDPDEILLCVDFGTAMSKVCARNLPDDGIGPLALGRVAEEPSSIYAVTSSVFISSDGMVYFGPEAVRKSELETALGRSRFDSIKQQISSSDISTLDAYVPKDINPLEIQFTYRELVISYLSFLAELTTECLEKEGLGRYALRRFAIPNWDEHRRSWARKNFPPLLQRAQIMADSLGPALRTGVPAETLKQMLQNVKLQERLPQYLTSEKDGVLEALAAGNSVFREETAGKRELFLVIDVGAGTTDLALFRVLTNHEGETKAWPAAGTIVTVRQAGDSLDSRLKQYIAKKHDLSLGDLTSRGVKAHLDRNIRKLKEQLFLTGELRDDLPDDTSIQVTLGEFLESTGVRKFSKILENAVTAVFNGADKSWFNGDFGEDVKVLATGGGANLPMVESLTRGLLDTDHGPILRTPKEIVPEWVRIESPDLVTEYSKLAVAIGGSAETIPSEMKEYGKYHGGPAKKYTILPNYKS